MEERRKYVRISDSLMVSYQKMLDSFKASCRSVDISENGIRLSISQRIEPGSVLKLWVNLEGIMSPIEALGEVVWLKERIDAKSVFDIGIKFLEIDDEDRSKLCEHIRKISKGKESRKIDWIG